MPAVNVVHLMRTYGVHGGERQLFRLFSGPADPRFSISFCFLYRDPQCRDYFSSIPGIRMDEVLPFSIPPRRSLAVEMLILLLLLPFIQVRLAWMISRSGAGVCVAHGVHAAVSCWLAAVLLRRSRFVYIHRGTKSASGRHWLFGLLYAPFDVVAGVSVASAASLRGLTGSTKPIVIENGIDCAAYKSTAAAKSENSDRPLVFGSVGRLISGKGHRLLLQAFAVVKRRLAATELRLAGDGPERGELMNLAVDLGIADAVRFTGRCDDVGQFLSECDVFVFASESEGLSNSVLEAMACGLPSVVVDAPGVTECHIDGATGLVVSRNSVELANGMFILATDSASRRKFGLSARLRVETYYSIEANRHRFAELYEGLTEAKR